MKFNEIKEKIKELAAIYADKSKGRDCPEAEELRKIILAEKRDDVRKAILSLGKKVSKEDRPVIFSILNDLCPGNDGENSGEKKTKKNKNKNKKGDRKPVANTPKPADTTANSDDEKDKEDDENKNKSGKPKPEQNDDNPEVITIDTLGAQPQDDKEDENTPINENSWVARKIATYNKLKAEGKIREFEVTNQNENSFEAELEGGKIKYTAENNVLVSDDSKIKVFEALVQENKGKTINFGPNMPPEAAVRLAAACLMYGNKMMGNVPDLNTLLQNNEQMLKAELGDERFAALQQKLAEPEKSEPQVENSEPKNENSEPKNENSEPKNENSEPKSESLEPKSESLEPKNGKNSAENSAPAPATNNEVELERLRRKVEAEKSDKNPANETASTTSERNTPNTAIGAERENLAAALIRLKSRVND